MAKVTYDLGQVEDIDISLSEVDLKVKPALPLPDPSQLLRCQAALSASRKAMAVIQRRYGLTSATIQEFELGLRERPTGPWITIPVRGGYGKLINVRSRYIGRSVKINETSKYTNWPGHADVVLYPVDKLPPPGSPLLIVCGMFDAMVGYQHGVPTVTWTGGVNAAWPEDWLDIAEHWDVTILLDRGEERHADRLADKLGCSVVHLPAELPAGTDLVDMFVKHGWSQKRLLRLLRHPYSGLKIIRASEIKAKPPPVCEVCHQSMWWNGSTFGWSCPRMSLDSPGCQSRLYRPKASPYKSWPYWNRYPELYDDEED